MGKPVFRADEELSSSVAFCYIAFINLVLEYKQRATDFPITFSRFRRCLFIYGICMRRAGASEHMVRGKLTRLAAKYSGRPLQDRHLDQLIKKMWITPFGISWKNIIPAFKVTKAEAVSVRTEQFKKNAGMNNRAFARAYKSIYKESYPETPGPSKARQTSTRK